MIECTEFIGNVVRKFTIYEDSIDGPEILYRVHRRHRIFFLPEDVHIVGSYGNAR